jgi:trimeric autotransporter adhesin
MVMQFPVSAKLQVRMIISITTVYIGGAGILDSSFTAAFVSTSTTTTARNIRNNIFVNERSNAGSTGKNYAIRLANSTNLTANNNIYRANGLGGVYGLLGATDYPTFGSWKTTGLDGSSTSADPNFVNKNAAASLVDLHVQSPTPVEANGFAIASVTTDFDGQLRSSLTATDIGADAGNFVGIDVIPPTITYSNLVNTGVVTSKSIKLQQFLMYLEFMLQAQIAQESITKKWFQVHISLLLELCKVVINLPEPGISILIRLI